MKVKIDILHAGVMNQVEGLSVIVAERLAKESAYTYEQLWASASDTPKLDIFYKEAIADLELKLKKYIQTSTAIELPMGAEGQDYSVTLKVGPWFPQKLEGVLKSKVIEYVVHAVIAGWLSGYADLKPAQDYAQTVVSDMADIKTLLMHKALQDNTSERVEDSDDSATGEGTDLDAVFTAQERMSNEAEVTIEHDTFDLSGTDFGLTGDRC